MRVATLFREVPSVRNGVTQLEKITIRRGYGRAATRTGEGGIILRNIIGSILIAVFLAGSVEGQWNQIPSSWGEIQNAPGDITDITITTSSPLTGGSACTSGACAFTLGLGTVPISKGGTSITTFTLGDVLYSSATNVLSKLAIGTAGQCLVVTAGIPAWGSCSSGAGTVTSVDASGGTTGFSFSGGPITGAGTLTLTGTLAAASFPALTGDVTTSAGSVATSVVKVNGTTPGGSCTNQFVRSLSSSAVPTCASVANADLAGSIDLTTKVTGTLPVANGGTGVATTTAYSPVFSGTTATGAFSATIGPGLVGQKIMSAGAGAYPTWASKYLWVSTADVTVANTTTETTMLGAGAGTLTIPANALNVAGNVLSVKISGNYGRTGTPTLRLRVKLGGTAISDLTLTVALSGMWFSYLECATRVTGASGSITCSNVFNTPGNGPGPSTATTAIDLTASQAVDITLQWGTASASNTVTQSFTSIELAR